MGAIRLVCLTALMEGYYELLNCKNNQKAKKDQPCLRNSSDGRSIISIIIMTVNVTWQTSKQTKTHKKAGKNPPTIVVTYLIILTEVFIRFVLKGPCYNPMDVLNCLFARRGYKVFFVIVTATILVVMVMINDHDHHGDDRNVCRCKGNLSREPFPTSIIKTTST